jgi:hypothetical protein
MAFEVPARQDDFPNSPELRRKLLEGWNDRRGRFLGNYVSNAVDLSKNYVDPATEPPTGAAAAVPWNGFPKLMSRWYQDGASDAAKETAERVADIPTPLVFWFNSESPDERSPRSVPMHWLPIFANQPGARFASTPRLINADGTLGPPMSHLRRQQDEYLEWHAVRDAGGRLRKLAFTAEAPDYWLALAMTAQEAGSNRLLELYRELIGPEVQASDLFYQTDLAVPFPDASGNLAWRRWHVRGQYNVLNRWTTADGLVHLTHAANTLGAEVALAAEASVLWASDRSSGPSSIAVEIRRIACGAYGGINRSSDPLIGKGVGDAIVGGARITLADPIGLYIADIAIDGLTGPNGEAVGRSALRILRGTDDAFEPRMLRFEVELPPGTPFHLDDCVIDGRKLKRGGQIARKVSLQLYANTYPNSVDPQTPAEPCDGAVCRHSARPDVFTIGSDGNGAAQCPDAASAAWLRQTPFEGTPPSFTPMAAPSASALPVTVPAEAGPPAPPLIARSRADHGT